MNNQSTIIKEIPTEKLSEIVGNWLHDELELDGPHEISWMARMIDGEFSYRIELTPVKKENWS